MEASGAFSLIQGRIIRIVSADGDDHAFPGFTDRTGSRMAIDDCQIVSVFFHGVYISGDRAALNGGQHGHFRIVFQRPVMAAPVHESVNAFVCERDQRFADRLPGGHDAGGHLRGNGSDDVRVLVIELPQDSPLRGVQAVIQIGQYVPRFHAVGADMGRLTQHRTHIRVELLSAGCISAFHYAGKKLFPLIVGSVHVTFQLRVRCQNLVGLPFSPSVLRDPSGKPSGYVSQHPLPGVAVDDLQPFGDFLLVSFRKRPDTVAVHAGIESVSGHQASPSLSSLSGGVWKSPASAMAAGSATPNSCMMRLTSSCTSPSSQSGCIIFTLM